MLRAGLTQGDRTAALLRAVLVCCCSRVLNDGDAFHFQKCPGWIKNYMVLLVTSGIL